MSSALAAIDVGHIVRKALVLAFEAIMLEGFFWFPDACFIQNLQNGEFG